MACDGDGVPDFYRLHFHRHGHGLCVWAFDLLHHNGRDIRELPLFERKAKLEKLIVAAPIGNVVLMQLFQFKLDRAPNFLEGPCRNSDRKKGGALIYANLFFLHRGIECDSSVG